MAFIGAPKYFIGFFLLFTCGYLSNSVLSDTYHYIFLLDNRNNDFYISELTDEASDLLKEYFSDILINSKLKKAALRGSIRECINILGTLGYRILHYRADPNLPEWILEKRIPSENISKFENISSDISSDVYNETYPQVVKITNKSK